MVGGVAVVWEDALDAIVLDETTAADGSYAAEVVPAGRYTARLSIGHFAGIGTVRVVDDEAAQELGALCLDRGDPRALVFGAEVDDPADAVDERLEGLGLVHVQLGPSTAAGMAEHLSTPQGLSEYGLVAVSGHLDYETLLNNSAGVGGIEDFLGSGGGLYLSGSAHQVLAALDPEAIAVGEEQGRAQYVLASVVDPAVSEALGVEQLGIPLDSDTPLPTAFGASWEVVVEGEVELPSGEVVLRPLVARGTLVGGRALYSAVRAPQPAAGEWWRGSPQDFSLPDGTWDGRGALLDRLLLEL